MVHFVQIENGGKFMNALSARLYFGTWLFLDTGSPSVYFGASIGLLICVFGVHCSKLLSPFTRYAGQKEIDTFNRVKHFCNAKLRTSSAQSAGWGKMRKRKVRRDLIIIPRASKDLLIQRRRRRHSWIFLRSILI